MTEKKLFRADGLHRNALAPERAAVVGLDLVAALRADVGIREREAEAQLYGAVAAVRTSE